MSTLNWHSLSQIKLNSNQSFIISWATDGNNKIVCGRVHLRYYVAGVPTRYGVCMKRWELSRLANFMIGHLNQTINNQQEEIDELTIEKTNSGDFALHKRDRRITICRDDAQKVLNLIPGLCYILGSLRVEGDSQNINKVLEDVFIFSRLLKENKDIYTIWEEEECLKTGKLTIEQIRILQKLDNIYDSYITNIGGILHGHAVCTKKQFNSRIMGQFVDSLLEPYSKDPQMIKSLALVLRGVSSPLTK